MQSTVKLVSPKSRAGSLFYQQFFNPVKANYQYELSGALAAPHGSVRNYNIVKVVFTVLS